ncbi:MAG: hypothetical protein ACRELY_10990 [Polyangiaceae bacterium]
MRSLLVVLLAVAALCACQKAPIAESNPVELHTYDVPKGVARPLITTFKDAFWVDDKTPPVGHATMTPDGRLLVVAPRNVQAGVQTLVDDVAKHPPVVDSTVELHYWMVMGHPSAAPGPISPGMKEVEPALEEIAKTQGPQNFTLIQHVQLSSLQDEWGKAEASPGDTAGSKLVISQHALESNDMVFARVEIHYGKNDAIETRVNLTTGQTVVLGTTGQRYAEAPDAGDGDGATLYYLVRVAPRADAEHQ